MVQENEMSAYSTLNITRSRAKKEILEHVAANASDYELEQIMDLILAYRLYNVRIVADGDNYNNEDEL